MASVQLTRTDVGKNGLGYHRCKVQKCANFNDAKLAKYTEELCN